MGRAGRRRFCRQPGGRDPRARRQDDRQAAPGAGPPAAGAAVGLIARANTFALRQSGPDSISAVPAKAGTHFSERPEADRWVPAFAGTTVQREPLRVAY